MNHGEILKRLYILVWKYFTSSSCGGKSASNKVDPPQTIAFGFQCHYKTEHLENSSRLFPGKWCPLPLESQDNGLCYIRHFSVLTEWKVGIVHFERYQKTHDMGHYKNHLKAQQKVPLHGFLNNPLWCVLDSDLEDHHLKGHL